MLVFVRNVVNEKWEFSKQAPCISAIAPNIDIDTISKQRFVDYRTVTKTLGATVFLI